jgi:hypothetical protein
MVNGFMGETAVLLLLVSIPIATWRESASIALSVGVTEMEMMARARSASLCAELNRAKVCSFY